MPAVGQLAPLRCPDMVSVRALSAVPAELCPRLSGVRLVSLSLFVGNSLADRQSDADANVVYRTASHRRSGDAHHR